MVQSGNPVPIQDALEFLVFSVRMHDFLNYLDCMSRCHSRMPPVFFLCRLFAIFCTRGRLCRRWRGSRVALPAADRSAMQEAGWPLTASTAGSGRLLAIDLGAKKQVPRRIAKSATLARDEKESNPQPLVRNQPSFTTQRGPLRSRTDGWLLLIQLHMARLPMNSGSNIRRVSRDHSAPLCTLQGEAW